MAPKEVQPKIWVKVLAFWGLFMFFYALYKLFPVFPLSIFFGVNESNFQHYKATFFILAFLDVIEFLIIRKRIASKSNFWYSRMTATIFAPWLVFLLWYIAPAIYGQMSTVWFEILYVNILTLIAGITVTTFESNLLCMQFSKSMKIIEWVLL